jgi:hypothetical protein
MNMYYISHLFLEIAFKFVVVCFLTKGQFSGRVLFDLYSAIGHCEVTKAEYFFVSARFSYSP